jgi:hypothetical protein
MPRAATGSMWRRVAAVTIDIVVGLALGLLLSQTRVGIFFAERAVVMLRIGSPDTIWKGPIPMIMGYLGTLVYVLPLAFLLVALIGPMTGRSPGNRLLRVAPNQPTQRRWYETAIRTMPLWGLVAALLAGSWQLALLFLIAGLALNVALLLR